MNPFGGNSQLVSFSFDNGETVGTNYAMDDASQAVYTQDYKILKRVAPGIRNTFTIHPSCEKIGYAACSSCMFSTASFSESLELLDSYAFYVARITAFNLSHVYCKDNAFHGAYLTSCDIPGYWGCIENAVFYANTRMVTAIIGSGITYIGVSECIQWAAHFTVVVTGHFRRTRSVKFPGMSVLHTHSSK